MQKEWSERMKNEEIMCRSYDGDRCEYYSEWFCKNPLCKAYILTSTLKGARPSGCPKVDLWNRKEEKEVQE